jgi:hypothetical protein
MAKASTARLRLEAIALFYNYLRSRSDEGVPAKQSTEKRARKQSTEKRARDIADLEQQFDQALTKAYEKLNLDPNSDRDSTLLLVGLAYAVFGGKGPGAPLKWSPKKYLRLLTDVSALRAENPKLRETECCELLRKGKVAGGRYEAIKSSTLRRRLQRAKALQREAKALFTRGHAGVDRHRVRVWGWSGVRISSARQLFQ